MRVWCDRLYIKILLFNTSIQVVQVVGFYYTDHIVRVAWACKRDLQVSYKFNDFNQLEQLLSLDSSAGIVSAMAKRTKKRRGKKAKVQRRTDPSTFLPEFPDVVRAIAMQGVTDDELAFSFGLNPKIIRAWRKIYPDFEKAIEEGRTIADLQVVEALHKKAIGHSYDTDIVIKTKHGYEIETITKTDPPETNAIRYWLSNRDPKRWSDRRHLQVTGKGGEPALGVKQESKVELMNSIISLIQPKPDGV